jgi:hypothetical protein
MEPSESRIVPLPFYPNSVYFQATVYYLASNFGFYQLVFRRTGDRRQFAAFMLVNMFTSLSLAELTNPRSVKHYAAFLNNTQEMEHRRQLSENLRKNLFARSKQLKMF